MASWTHIRKLMLRYFSESRWYTIVTITFIYGLLAWLMLSAAGEEALTSHADFFYWMAVTASTVGYGDLSPVTPAGKIIVSLYVIPVGLSIFAMVVGRIAAWVSHHWQRGLLGMKPLHVENHILVIGWNENKTLPVNNASTDTFKRRLNAVINWGIRNSYECRDLKKFKLSSPPARLRVFTPDEINLIINHFEPLHFRRFVEFAYNTGGRSGEIRVLKSINLKDGNLFVKGKTGHRTIVLNQRATKLLDWFNYRKEYVSNRFKKECRKHGIKNARFHDIRRTFGYRLILNGMSIYHVSKLLGHSSVTTTERHYAPLMATEIEEFVL